MTDSPKSSLFALKVVPSILPKTMASFLFVKIPTLFVETKLLVSMIVIIGRLYMGLIGRGDCLENKTCYCLPFYSGEFCETFIGCPQSVSPQICQQILTLNQISQVTLENQRGGLLSFFGDSHYFSDDFHAELIKCKNQCFIKDCNSNSDDMEKYMCKFVCAKNCKKKLIPTFFNDQMKLISDN